MTWKRATVAAVTALLCAATGALAAGPAAARALTAPAADTPQGQADAAIAAHPEAIRGAPGDQYTAVRVITDRSGARHVRYLRRYQGLPVIGGDFVVHLAADGSFTGASVALRSALDVSTTPQV